MGYFGEENPTISPAYGRDYKSRAEVVIALNKGVDFSVGGGGGPYLSIRDLKDGDVGVRYKKLTMKAIIKIKGNVAS